MPQPRGDRADPDPDPRGPVGGSREHHPRVGEERGRVVDERAGCSRAPLRCECARACRAWGKTHPISMLAPGSRSFRRAVGGQIMTPARRRRITAAMARNAMEFAARWDASSTASISRPWGLSSESRRSGRSRGRLSDAARAARHRAEGAVSPDVARPSLGGAPDPARGGRRVLRPLPRLRRPGDDRHPGPRGAAARTTWCSRRIAITGTCSRAGPTRAGCSRRCSAGRAASTAARAARCTRAPRSSASRTRPRSSAARCRSRPERRSRRRRGSDQVTMWFFGDGAMEEGAVFETLNLAALWKLPVIFMCENNTTEALGAAAGGYSCVGDRGHRPARDRALGRRPARRRRRDRCGRGVRRGAGRRSRGRGPGEGPTFVDAIVARWPGQQPAVAGAAGRRDRAALRVGRRTQRRPSWHRWYREQDGVLRYARVSCSRRGVIDRARARVRSTSRCARPSRRACDFALESPLPGAGGGVHATSSRRRGA